MHLFHLDAVCVLWDGNCLFRAASLLLAGCERSSHKFLRLQMAKELARYNEYYLGVHVLSGHTGKLNKKTSTPKSPLLCLARCLITQAIKYLVNITKMFEAFAEALKTTAEKCQKSGSYVSLPEALSLTSVMGVNLNMIYPDTHSTSSFKVCFH